MAEVTVTARTREQGDRLRKLRLHLGISKPELCARLGFGTTQTLDLYERGVSIIRVDRIEAWAEAFEMNREDFIEAVMGKGDITESWSFRAALHGHIPDWLIDELAEEWEGRPVINQKAAAKAVLQMAESQRRRNTPDTLQTRPA